MNDLHTITSIERLLEVYPNDPGATSIRKESPVLTPSYAAFITAAPFCVVSTVGRGGVDQSPRGDAPGFVRVRDERTLVIPDRRGNNRLDGLHDILENPEVALLFLIPGVGETLRVQGSARITTDPALRARFAVDGKEPATVLLVAVREVYAHCAKSIMRAQLWGGRERPPGVPTNGQMIAAHSAGGRIDPEQYEAEYQARIRAQMY